MTPPSTDNLLQGSNHDSGKDHVRQDDAAAGVASRALKGGNAPDRSDLLPYLAAIRDPKDR